jgi:hypothetical protein
VTPLNSSHYRGFFALVVAILLVPAALGATPSFTPQGRVGFSVGDQWEPAVAADGFGHIYVLYPQYGRMPGCRECLLPSMVLVVSKDNGATWQPPREITPPGTRQYDPQILVDPLDHRTVYATWLQNFKLEVAVAKSVDFGQSWSVSIADRGKTDADKPVLAVRGQDVYVGFNRARKMWVAASHDGGMTFASSDVGRDLRLVRALAGGATVDPDGNAFVAWAGYARQDGAKGRVNLYISKSVDDGETWKSTLMDSSGAPPDCSAFHCSWGFLGAQIAMTSDVAGTLYALWNSGKSDKSPERIYFASSTTAGDTWSEKKSVSGAPNGVEHAFPAIAAGADDDVRIAWMDTRLTPLWNTFYRSSTNGGATWSEETRLSSYVSGFRYIRLKGFNFPFGDYFGIAIDNKGSTHVVWGEGQNFRSPGSIWHTSGR